MRASDDHLATESDIRDDTHAALGALVARELGAPPKVGLPHEQTAAPALLSRSRRLGWAPLVVCAATALIAVLVWWSATTPNEREPTRETLVATNLDDPLRELAPWGGARVDVGEDSVVEEFARFERGATIGLVDGSLRFEVEDAHSGSWTVVAGPFSVSVVGTAFEVSWTAARGLLVVSVERGIVEVADGRRLGARVRLVAGDTLRATLSNGWNVESKWSESARDWSRRVAGLAPARGARRELAILAKASSPPDPRDTAARSRERSAPRWVELAQDARYADAMGLLDSRTIASIRRSASLDRTLLLADAQRLTGRLEEARETLEVHRRRAGGGTIAGQRAAVLLGRLAADRGRADDALEWFAKAERGPSSRWQGEALGRSLLLLRDQGRAKPARDLARRYLDRHPDGPWASVARLLAVD